jgi:hypothetical protein
MTAGEQNEQRQVSASREAILEICRKGFGWGLLAMARKQAQARVWEDFC